MSIYDDKGKMIQTQSTNISGGTDVMTMQYGWSGLPIIVVQKQQKGITNDQVMVTVTKNNYDNLGRVVNVEKKQSYSQVNGDVMSEYNTLSTLEYDALGQLKTKTLALDYHNGTGLEILTYDYNIRGWLLGINRDYAKEKSVAANKFGFDLGYDKETIANSTVTIGNYITPAFNGNISGTVWKSAGDGEIRKYDFTYDAVNRITGADFNQYTSNTFDKTAGIDFSLSNMSYDANGNIKTMNQNGLKLNSSSPIDQLTYTYQANSNKLAKVTDAIIEDNKLGDFKDGNNGAADDYDYDANGNLEFDKNKDISNITYNYLNLPSVITVTDKGTITYTYDAAGNKHEKVTIDNTINPSKTTTTTYLGGMVYENDVLQFIAHEEGRIRPLRNDDNNITDFAYDYFIKDHLGNIRMVLTEEQKTIYYPAATLEGTYSPDGTSQANSMVNFEKGYYKIDNTKITLETSIPSWGTETAANTKLYYNHNGNPPANTNYPAGTTPAQTTGSAKLYKLNATSNKTGLEFMIKVMAGDKIDIFGKSYYLNTTNITNGNSTLLDLLGLMTNILLAPGNPAAGKGISAATLNTMNSGLVPTSFFRGNNSEATTKIPKAYINYIFLDEQFKFAGGNASRVGTSGTVKNHWNIDAQLQNITVPKNGYIFVYVSNESNFDVFFDNLQVIHKPGPILEETHYYPFGLTMAGISSKAAGGLENKHKYNGIEFENDLDLNTYEAFFRELDPQTGRWWQIDPKVENMEMWSPYVSNYDNPILYQDPLGDEGEACCGGFLDALVDAGDKIMVSASGVLWGGLNTMSNGIISSDPFDLRSRLSSENQMYFDNAINVGKVAPLFATRGRTGRAMEVAPELAPVGVAPKVKVKMESANPGVAIPNQVQAKANKGPNDLGGGGKNAQHANQKARGAAEKRYNDAKVNRDKLNSKPNKTKEDKQELDKLNKQVRHEKQKMDNVGENHSRKAKGSN